MNKKISIYLASGWFTPKTKAILDELESFLSSKDNVNLYSPRRDGVELPANQKHDTTLRESVFNDNIRHILDADVVVANVYSGDDYNDPGTMYEIGYAMANNIPVVGYTPIIDERISERFTGIFSGFDTILSSLDLLDRTLDIYGSIEEPKIDTDKVLFVGAGNENVDKKLVSYIMDSGTKVRWINEGHSDIYTHVDDIFKDIKYMIAVIDDRKTLVSWMIGQAYARGIPVITYSDFNYMINIMLLVSVRTHLRGTDELVEFLQKVKREGLESIPKFDISSINAC